MIKMTPAVVVTIQNCSIVISGLRINLPQGTCDILANLIFIQILILVHIVNVKLCFKKPFLLSWARVMLHEDFQFGINVNIVLCFYRLEEGSTETESPSEDWTKVCSTYD